MNNKYFIVFVLIVMGIGLLLGIANEANKTNSGNSLFQNNSTESIARGLNLEYRTYQGEKIEKDALYLFFLPTCPHCQKEKEFLRSTISREYPDLPLYLYDVGIKENVPFMIKFAKIHGIEDYVGRVPVTFIGDKNIKGYSTDSTTGQEIVRAIELIYEGERPEQVGEYENITSPTEEQFDDRATFHVPFIGAIYEDDFSLPILAIVLGFLDGFNVCSLGALVLIIGLTLKLQRRRAIILLGGTFIITTALIYGALIVIWAQIFQVFASYIDGIKIFVSILALGGGLYFLKEFFRMRKQGPMCELSESKIINKLMERTGNAFEDNTKLLGLLGTVLLFAAVITVVEFPCSAATPTVFAGILASSGLSTLAQTAYIGLFVLFYMLDELIIFGIAAYRLKLWMTSGTFTKYAVLAEAIILIIIAYAFLQPLLKPALLSLF